MAEIKILELGQKDVVLMPLEYILQEVDGTEFVYLSQLTDEGQYRAKKQYVTIGEATDGLIIIEEGLDPGQSVIFRGARNVSDGELIEFSKI